MEWTDEKKAIGNQLFHAINRGQTDLVRELCGKYPWLVCDYQECGKDTWISVATSEGNLEMLKTLMDLGFNIHAVDRGRSSPLSCAIYRNHYDVIEFMLTNGVTPNHDRTLISAMNRPDPADQIRLVKLLVRHGADVNQLYDVYGDKDHLFSALDWASSKPKVAEYLRAQGAKTSDELLGRTPEPQTPGTDLAGQVRQYFEENFGKAESQALVEIVPTEPAIAINVVPVAQGRREITLFTTGCSAFPLTLPAGLPGAEAYQWCEVFMQLPAGWKYRRLNDPQWGWPIHELRQIARYPHQHQTWLGGLAVVIDCHPNLAPIAPGVRFCSFLLLAEKSFLSSDGRTVQLYRATPIYPEEREIVQRADIPALLRAMDAANIGFVVDVTRPSAAPAR